MHFKKNKTKLWNCFLENAWLTPVHSAVQRLKTCLFKISATSQEHTVWYLWSITAAEKHCTGSKKKNKKDALYNVVICWVMNSLENRLAVQDRLFKPPVDGQINGVCLHIHGSRHKVKMKFGANLQLPPQHWEAAYGEICVVCGITGGLLQGVSWHILECT